jgi:peptide/nickel transport system ATP-binding protein
VLHNKGISKPDARARVIDLLGQVGIPNPAGRYDAYTFQLSGGMRQRAMIAMALACSPQLLIADESTTALDVTTQAQIPELMLSLQQEFGSSPGRVACRRLAGRALQRQRGLYPRVK